MEFTVTGKPVPQPRPRVFRDAKGRSRAINSSKSVTYKRLVKATAISEMNRRRLRMTEAPLSITLTFSYAPPPSYTLKKKAAAQAGRLRYVKRPDLDNLEKGVLDALNGTVYKDDAQIINLNLNKEYGDTDQVLIQINEV